MDIYLMRSWTHHEPKRPRGTPGVLQVSFKSPKGRAAVMLHLGNIPVEGSVDAAWIKRQIEGFGLACQPGSVCLTKSPSVEVHQCCGCSCHVCANGHSGGNHTKACQERLMAEAEDGDENATDR